MPLSHDANDSPTAPAAHRNRLARETSPYLLQHAHNPVDWYPWGEEALRRAREEDRPILLSVGYSACHWCHVMERESFEDPDIAALMNAGFVNVKVDREERPDVDQLYMGAVQLMAGQGGWPMTVFLTPEGRPFYGGTYFPPEDRYGRPGFARILQAVAEAWRERRGELEAQSVALLDHLRQPATAHLPESAGGVTVGHLTQAFENLLRGFDERLGGFGDAPKFPQPMALDFVLRFALRTRRPEALRVVTVTLDQMAAGGIYDHLGGGFHRYSTDRFWLVPHFEKMLYDNAQLALTYLRAWQASRTPRYRQVVEQTLDYVRREMTDPAGGFYSTEDADSEGEEGRFYVWTLAEVQEVLGQDDAALFSRCYDVSPRGNWEGKSILNEAVAPGALARSLGVDPAGLEARLAEMRRRLRERRDARPRPGRDDKVIAAWNGLMLSAFADAAAAFGRADYLQTAVNNAEFVERELWRDGRLMRTGRSVPHDVPAGMDHPLHRSSAFRVAPIPGFLEDYACCAAGLLQLYEATVDVRWLDAARAFADAMLARFADPAGGLFSTEEDTPDAPPVRGKDVMDSATPSGASAAVDVLLRLAALTGEERCRVAAEGVLAGLGAAMAEHPMAFGRLLCAADLALGPIRELAIVGPPGPGTQALLGVARSSYHPNLIVAAAEPGSAAASDLAILAGKAALQGQATAYLCENYACRQPTTDPAELERQLAA